MADYILLRNSDDHVLEEADSPRFRKTGAPPVLKPEKGIRWLALVVVNPPLGNNQVKEGPVVDITPTTYTRTWTVRDKTEEEEAADKNEKAVDSVNSMRSLIYALNDGSFVPGSNYTNDQIKAKIEAKL